MEDEQAKYFAQVGPAIERALNEACNDVLLHQPPLSATNAIKLTGSLLQCPRNKGFAQAAEEANAEMVRCSSTATHAADEFEWSVNAWLRHQVHGDEVVDTIEQALLAPLGQVPSKVQQAYLTSLGQLGSAAGSSAFLELLHDGDVLEKLAHALWQGAKRLDPTSVTPARKVTAYAKFVSDSDSIQLTYGGTSTFLRGLEALIGPPNIEVLGTMTNEHTKAADSHQVFETLNYEIMTCPAIEWHFVYDPQAYEADVEDGLIPAMAKVDADLIADLAAKGLPPRPRANSDLEHRWPFESVLRTRDNESRKRLCRTPQPLEYFVHHLNTIENPAIRRAGGETVIMEELLAARLYTG
jgi:hypothetical protein